jgi:hypothetical protein
MAREQFNPVTFSHLNWFRKLDKFQPPNWASIPPGEWSKYEEIFSQWAVLARLSLDLVDRLAPRLLNLEGQIVRQYNTHVLQSFWDYINRQGQTRDKDSALK